MTSTIPVIRPRRLRMSASIRRTVAVSHVTDPSFVPAWQGAAREA